MCVVILPSGEFGGQLVLRCGTEGAGWGQMQRSCLRGTLVSIGYGVLVSIRKAIENCLNLIWL